MAEAKKEIELEIAHVLFIDIVGYSKLSVNDQHAAVEELNRLSAPRNNFVRRFSNTEFVGRGTTAGLPEKFSRIDFEVRYVFNLENDL